MSYKFGSRIEDVEERLNDFLARRYDEAHKKIPFLPKCKKACTVSNTPEPLKTHLQLNVGKTGSFDGLLVATEDYLRNRRIFKTTSNANTHDDDPMHVDAFSRKGTKGKERSPRARKVAREAKKVTQARDAVNKPQRNLCISRVSVETAESTDTRQLAAGTSIRSLE